MNIRTNFGAIADTDTDGFVDLIGSPKTDEHQVVAEAFGIHIHRAAALDVGGGDVVRILSNAEIETQLSLDGELVGYVVYRGDVHFR